MPAARPVLGYQSRYDACLALHSMGLSHRDIVQRFGAEGQEISTTQIAALLTYARKRNAYARITVPHEVMGPLVPHARMRGMTAAELAVRLLETISESGLINAVLDDQPEIKPRKGKAHG